MTLANLPQDNCFMPLPKPTGTDNTYFTIGMLPAALSIPCKLGPDLAKFKEVTVTNTNLLADMLTEFQLALVAAGKSGAVAVYPPLVLDFYYIFVTSSLMVFNLFSAEPPCIPSCEAHVPDLFCAYFYFLFCFCTADAAPFSADFLPSPPTTIILRNSQTSTLLTCFARPG